MARKTNTVFTTTKEDIDNILPENKELIAEYINYLEATDHSHTSITVYKNNLNIFFIYLMKYCKNKDFVDIKKRDIMNFQNYMIKNGLSSARIRVIRSTISSLGIFIESVLDEEEKWEDFRNIVNKIPAPTSNPVREKTVLEENQCQELLDNLIEKGEFMKACAFALAWSSGRRKSELLRIKRNYITDDNLIYGSLYKTPEKIKTKGKGSMGKKIYVYILKSKFQKYYDLWMEERIKLGVPEDIDDIFIKQDTNGNWIPIQVSTLDSYAETFSKMLGVDFYFHCLRHNFTTALHKCSIPATVIKDLIGWESVEMVSLYTDVEVDDELGKYFGEEGIKEVKPISISEL